MSSSRSLRPWPRRCTTPHEDRGRPGPGRRRARRSARPSSGRLLLPSRCSSACTMRSPAGGGLPAWQSRRGHRNGFHSALWSPCSRRSCLSRLSMFLCCRWWTSRWISCRFLSSRCPSRLLTCPRSLWTPLRSARCSLSRSWRSSWWKCLSLSPPSTTGSVGRRPTGARVTRGWVGLTGATPPAQGGI